MRKSLSLDFSSVSLRCHTKLGNTSGQFGIFFPELHIKDYYWQWLINYALIITILSKSSFKFKAIYFMITNNRGYEW